MVVISTDFVIICLSLTVSSIAPPAMTLDGELTSLYLGFHMYKNG